MLENRQKTGYDRLLPAAGLLIWHIDEAIESNSDEAHAKVALVQADNKRDLELGHNRGDGGDVFPGTSQNSAFTNESTPNSKSYAGADTNVAVTKITASGAAISANLAVKPAKAKESKESKKERAKERAKEKEFFKDLFDWKMSWESRGAKASEAAAWGAAFAPSDLEARLAALEARLAAIEPFIDRTQRPDLSQSALEDEEDLEAIRQEMEEELLKAKRLFDSKPREY